MDNLWVVLMVPFILMILKRVAAGVIPVRIRPTRHRIEGGRRVRDRG